MPPGPAPTLSPHRSQGLSRTGEGRYVPSLGRRTPPLTDGSSRLVGWAVTAGVTLLALLLRLWDLGKPHSFLFDETYYAKDAWSLLHHGYALNYVDNANQRILAGHLGHLWTGTPEMVVHPEVGKWLIAAGEWTFGMTPFGWRVMPAVFGSLMVLVMVRLARRMTGSTLLGAVAGLIIGFDGLELTLSRLALLDIFQAFFLLSAVSCLVADRDWGRSRLTVPIVGDGPGPWLLWRPWRLAAGAMFGLSLATKWGSLFPLAGFGLLMWAWDAGARRRLGVRRPWLRSAVMDALPSALWFVVVPFVVYLASWTGWLLHASAYEKTLSNTQYGDWGTYVHAPPSHGIAAFVRALRDLWHYHLSVLDFHTTLRAHHPYQSQAPGWILMSRPVGADAQLDIQPGVQGCTATSGSTCLRQVLILGNPAVWWPSVVGLLYAVVAWVGRRDWRFGVVVVGVATTWLPWWRFGDRPIFVYYAINMLPFLVLGLTLLLGRVLGAWDASPRRRTVGAVAAGAYVLLVLVAFGWFWPIWTDQLITQSGWVQRIWFTRWI